MNILMKMYQGSFVLESNNIGHEWINLIRADDGYFYIWLNSSGAFSRKINEDDQVNILMVRTISDGIYSIVGKAEDCLPIGCGCQKLNDEVSANAITYQGKSLTEIYGDNGSSFVTFRSQKVCKANSGFYVTPDKTMVDNERFFKLNITAKTSMRQYFESGGDFVALLENKAIWEDEVSKDTVGGFVEKYASAFSNNETMFSILKKESNENAISNSIAYFLDKYGLAGRFLNHICDNLDKNELYSVLRERGDVDLLFVGQRNLVVVENKVYSKINGKNPDDDLEKQLKKILKSGLVAQLLEESELTLDNIRDEMLALVRTYERPKSKQTSQLSKYHMLAKIIAKCKGIDSPNVHLYLLMPDFRKPIEDKIGKNLFCYKQYKRIYYSDLAVFFDGFKPKYHDVYFDDFVEVIKKFSQKTNCIYEAHLAMALKRVFDL